SNLADEKFGACAKVYGGQSNSRLKFMFRKLLFLPAVLIAIQLVAQTPAKGPEGSWEGTLEAGERKLRLALTLSKNPDGTYSGSLDSLDQGATIPIEVVKVEGDSVQLELSSIGARFVGKLNADSSELTGQFTQGDTLPLTFKRSSSATPAASPVATPAASPAASAA